MKTKLLLFLIILLCRNLAGQEASNHAPTNVEYAFSTRIGLNSFNQINLQFEKPLNEKRGVRLNLGYNYGAEYLFRSGIFCSAESLLIPTFKRGLITKLGFVFYKEANYFENTWMLLLDYRKNSIDDLIVDEGCHAGTNSGLLEIFDWDANDIGVMLYRDFLKRPDKLINMYFGFGTSLRFEKKEYSVIRTGSSPPESDKIENNIKALLRFDFGIRMSFIEFRT